MSYSIQTEKLDNSLIVKLEGQFTIYQAGKLKNSLLEFFNENKPIQIDLSKVSEIDSACIQVLIAFKKEVKFYHKDIHFVHHSLAVLKLFEIYGLIGLLEDKIVISPDIRKEFKFSYGTKKLPTLLKL